MALKQCSECSRLFGPAPHTATLCKTCNEGLERHINEFLDGYKEFILDKNKNQTRLSMSPEAPLVILQFGEQEKGSKGKDTLNTSQLTDTARTIKRPIIVILCNTGEYKTLEKKQQTLPVPERLVALQSILTSAL